MHDDDHLRVSPDFLKFGRGAFLSGALAAMTLAAVPRAAVAHTVGAPNERTLWLVRMQTGESVYAAFTIDGRTIFTPGYNALCGLLRDTHVPLSEGDVQIDPTLIEALWEVQQAYFRAGIHSPINVHSGYRTIATNRETPGAVPNSQHTLGKAVDMHVDGLTIKELWDTCWSDPHTGGCGYYPGGWVHLDTGPRRYWTG